MSATVAKEPKKKADVVDDRSNRKSAPIQVEKDLARMAAVVASHKGITQSELISPVLRPFLLAQYAQVQEAIRKELDEQPDRE